MQSSENDDNWLRTKVGDIVSKDNIDSYIPELTKENSVKLLKEIQNEAINVKNNQKGWQEYFNTLEQQGQGCIVDLIKNTDDLSKLTGEDLVKANQQARESAIAHNNTLKQQTLGAKAASVAFQTLSIAGNMIAFTLITKGIELVVKGFDNWIHRVEKANEAIEESRSEYENANSEIESMNSELETTKQSISELKSKGVLSFTDKAELEKLRQQNDELEKNIALQEKKKGNAANKAVNQIQKNKEDLFDDFDDAIRDYNSYKEEYENTDEIGRTGIKNGTISPENYEATMESMKSVLLPDEKKVLEKIETFEKYKDDIINRYNTDDSSQYSDSDKKLYDDITQRLQNAYHAVYSDSEYNKLIIEPILKKDEFKNLYDQLLKYFVSGGSTDLSALEGKFGNDVITSLRNACNNAGVDFDDMMQDIYENSQKNIDRIAPIIKEPNGAFDAKQNSASKSIRDFIENDLSEEDRTVLLYATIPEEQKFENINDVKEFINSLKDTTDENSIPIPLSFQQAWDSLGTTGDEEMQKAGQEAKETLLELAKAGELTPEVLENNETYATLLKSVGNNAEIAADNINKMVETSDQLSSMKSGIAAISDVLAEKQNNLKNKKTKEVGIGADKLAGFDDNIKNLDAWKNFEKTLGNGKSSMEECQQAANKLATEWVNSNNFLSQLDETNEDYYISTLKEMGVENAEAVVTTMLTQKKQELELAEKYLNAAKESNVVTTNDLSNATAGEINRLASEQKWSDETKQALYRLALQKQIANGIHLNTSKDINNLKAFVKGLGGSGKALSTYQKMLKHGGSYSTPELANAWRKAKQEVEDAANSVDITVDPSPTIPDNPKNNNNPKEPKETKQSFDWLERKVTVLTDKLDLLKAKIENVFSVNEKNSFINKEIKKTNALINAYKKQAKVYKQQANKSARATKTESGEEKTKLTGKKGKKLKKKIQNGEIKGSREQLMKAYVKKKTNAIQEYQSNWDKYQEARTNIQSARKSRHDLKIQKKQNKVDYYDALSEQYEAEIENLSTAKAKNKLEKDRVDYIKKSYDKQIAIAKLEKDSVKAATLLAQKWKAIADSRERILQNTLDENADKRDYNNAAYENADNTGKKKFLQSNIASYKSDDSAYSTNLDSAKHDAKKMKGDVTKKGKAVTAQMKKDKLNKSMMKKIQSYINKGQKIPDDILSGTKVMLPDLYQKLVAYNKSIDSAELGNEAVIEAENKKKLSSEKNKTYEREDRSKMIQLAIDAADNKYDRFSAEYENLTTASAKNSNIDEQLKAQEEAHNNRLEQLKNDIIDEEEQREAIAKENAEWIKTQREQHITQLQNFSDEQAALYDLNQQRENNADSAKEKNKYEAMSRNNLKAQYAYQIQIAQKNKDTVEEERLRAELAEKIEESYEKQIANIREEYDLIIGMNNARKSSIDAQISALQANGYGVGTDLYEMQIALDEASYKKSVEKIARISEQLPTLSGDALKEAEMALESEKQASWEYQQAMAEAQQAINDINLAKFERLRTLLKYNANDLEYMQDILSHSDFTFSDKEIGGLTMEGLSNMALNFAQMSNNTAQISNLYDQIAEKQRQLSNGEYTGNGDQITEEIDALIQEAHDLESANYDLGESIKDTVIDSLNSLSDALDESISKYKDALQAQKDLYDYRRKVVDQLKSIASLEKQLAALQGSDTEEARARIQKLQLELEDEQQNLKDMEYDKYIQDQEEMLDKVSEDFQGFIADVADRSVLEICAGMKDAVSDNLTGIKTSIQDAMNDSAAIGNLSTSISGLTEALNSIDYAGKVNTGVDKNDNAHYKYTDDNGNKTDIAIDNNNSPGSIIAATVNGEKVDIPEKEVLNTDKDINNAVSGTTDSSASNSASSQKGAPKIAGDIYEKEQEKMRNTVRYFLNNASSYFEGASSRMSSDPLNQYIYSKYKKMLDPEQEDMLLKHLGIAGDSSDRSALSKAVNKLKELGFSNGGVASELNKVALTNGDDGWATLKRGESILTPKQTEQFRKLALNLNPLNALADAVKPQKNNLLPNKTDYNNTTTIGNIDVHLDGSNVVDADSFIKTLHNPRVLKEVSNGVSSQMGTTMSNRLSSF